MRIGKKNNVVLGATILLLADMAVSQTLCPDGSYVGGSACSMASDGTYVGGEAEMAPDGSYVGGEPIMAPDGSYVGETGDQE